MELCQPGAERLKGQNKKSKKYEPSVMGSPSSEKGRHSDEGPVHKVKITKPFYLGKYEITQEQYEVVKGTVLFFDKKGIENSNNTLQRTGTIDAVPVAELDC